MLFNTIEFVVFFIFTISVIAVIKHRKFQHIFLLVASYFFFYFSSNYLISLLIFSTVLDFYVGKLIFNTTNKKRKKIFLSLSLVGNLGLLAFFKYTDFAIEQFNSIFTIFGIDANIELLHIILPIGISFYTFQTLSYTIDIYRGNLTPSKSLSEFALFVAFFPSLVAGPIIRAKDFLPQLREKLDNYNGISKLRQITIHRANLKLGITLMAFGFLKKMFFADNIAPLVNEIFASPIGLNSFEIWMGTIAFGFQIYGDFSGYSDIAIGAALIFGIKIPRNFNKPFFAFSPPNFWERWHISLSSWVRDYLYYPLIWNRRKSIPFVAISLFFTMIILGIWHGAGWNFIIFGMIHGLVLAFHRIFSSILPKNITNIFKTKIGKVAGIFITQYFVFMAFIAFRVHDLNYMSYAIQKYVFIDFQMNEAFTFLLEHKWPVSLMILFFILHFIIYLRPNIIDRISKFKIRFLVLCIAVIIFGILFLHQGEPQDFIYFKF